MLKMATLSQIISRSEHLNEEKRSKIFLLKFYYFDRNYIFGKIFYNMRMKKLPKLIASTALTLATLSSFAQTSLSDSLKWAFAKIDSLKAPAPLSPTNLRYQLICVQEPN